MATRRVSGPTGVNVNYPGAFGGMPGSGLQPTQPIPPSGLNAGIPGQLTSGPARNVPNLGIGGIGTSGATYTTNTEMSFGANKTIPHHYITQPSINNREDSEYISQLGVGMMVFARSTKCSTKKMPPDLVYSGGMTPHVDPSTTMLLEWSQLMEWLANHGCHYETPEEVASDWRLAGVVKVEVAPNSDRNYGKRSANRLLNVIVGQRVETFNIFGEWCGFGTEVACWPPISGEAGAYPHLHARGLGDWQALPLGSPTQLTTQRMNH